MEACTVQDAKPKSQDAWNSGLSPGPTSQDAKPRVQPGVHPRICYIKGGEPRVKPWVWRPEIWVLNTVCDTKVRVDDIPSHVCGPPWLGIGQGPSSDTGLGWEFVLRCGLWLSGGNINNMNMKVVLILVLNCT
jgi:hypothetical protein